MSGAPRRSAFVALAKSAFATSALVTLAFFSITIAPSLGQPADPLVYRRVLVPEDALAVQIRGLLPLNRDEFERRLAMAARDAHPDPSKATVRIEHAEFRARLVGANLKDGEADLAVVAATSKPALLSLEPCNLALHSATWQTPDPDAVIFGNDQTGALQCLVQQSGTLRLTWSQTATHTAPGTATFALRLPAAPRRRLEITATSDIDLSVDRGIIVGDKVDPRDPHQRIWSIELNGNPEVHLFAHQNAVAQSAHSLVVVREETNYSVLPAVVDLETRLTLDVLKKPLIELKLHAEHGLQITAVRVAEQSLPFYLQSADPDGPDVLTVPLPHELIGVDRVIELEATAPWDAQHPTTLPRIHVVNATLQQAQLEVHAPNWLRLHARPLGGCIQTDASPAAGSRTTDRFVFQTFAADGAIEVTPHRTLSPLREESGTQINVESNQVTGVLIAELTTTGGGAWFAIEAEVPRQWIVDSVETQPAEMLADRSLISRGAAPHRLQLKLARPLTAQQPLRLVIRGHLRRPPNDQPLGDEFFHLAKFPEVHDCHQLIAVRVNDPAAELQLSGDATVPRRDPRQLTPAERRLFEASPGTLLLEAGTTGETLRASLKAATARYRADAVVRAAVHYGRIEENIVIHCQPETSSVSSVVVRLAPRPRGEVTWRLAGDEDRELPALVESLSPSGAGGQEALVRLLLPRPYSTAFSLVCQWSSPQTAGAEISLAFLPSAIRQTGLLEIAAPDGGIFVRTSDLQSLPAPRTEDRSTALYGRYRYEAGQRSKVLVELLPSGVSQRRTWAESLELTSCFLPDGTGQHQAALRVQNAGADSLRLRLPSNVVECRLVGDNNAEHALDVIGSNNDVLVPLPADQSIANIRIRYVSGKSGVSRGSELGIWPIGTVRAPVPIAELPIMAQSWRVLLPPGLAAVRPFHHVDEDGALATGHTTPATPALVVSPMTRLDSLLAMLSGPALTGRLSMWPSSAPSATDPAFPGWSVLTLDLPPSTEATLVVYRPTVLGAWSCCLALVAASIVFLVPHRPGWPVLVAGLFGAMAVVSQPPLAWIVGGISVGLFLGNLLLLFRLRPPSASAPMFPSSILTARHAPTAGVLAILTILCAPRLTAAPPDTKPSPEHRRPRVVFPINKDQQAAGDYVFVEEALYEALHRVNDAIVSGLPAWLLENAQYDLPQTASVRPGGAAVEELRVRLDFHTFSAAATLRLPFRRDQVLLLEGRAQLDGTPVTLAWNPDGRALSLPVEISGKHRLEVALGAAAQKTADEVTLDIAVPRVAKSVVNLPRTGGGTLESDGANGRLAVRWPASEAAVPGNAVLEADQLLWWKIRPGSVAVEGRFRLRSLGGPIREVVLEVDPRLRLLPGRTAGPISGVKTEEGATNLLKLELTEPLSANVELRLAWLWPDASGIGDLLLPRATLRANGPSRDWAAVSLEPGLEIDHPLAAPPDAPAAQLAQIWPDINAAGTLLLNSDDTNVGRTLVIRPTQSLPRARQTSDWSVSALLAQVIYSARLTGVPATQYEYRLAVPISLKVSRVMLEQGSRSVAVRWTQQHDGTLVVSLLDQPAPEQTLTVSGDFPLAANRAQLQLPVLSLDSAIDEECVLRVYRHSDVQIELQPHTGWSSAENASLGQSRHGFGRLVAALARQSMQAAPPRISRTPNQSQVSGKMFTRIDEADGDWRCELHLRLAISAGVVDELRLSVPDEWSGPLEVDPVMEQRLEASANEARRQIVLRPREALSGAVEIEIRGPIHGSASGLQAPDVSLVGRHEIERLVLLDRGSAGEQIAWEITGLLAAGSSEMADLPAAWRPGGGDVFRVVGPRFDAIAKVRPASASAPRVPLMDLQTSPHPGRRLSVTASMIVHPFGAHDATFVLPPGCRLVQALVDGLPVPCVSEGIRSWKLLGPSDTLPYRLAIIYDTYVPVATAANSFYHLAAPLLVGMDVQQTLWSIENADALQAAHSFTAQVATSLGESAPERSLADAELARLQSTARALEAIVTAQGANLSPKLLAESFLRWKRSLTTIQHRLAAMQRQDELTADQIGKLQAALDAASKVEQRLVQGGVLDDSDTGESTAKLDDTPLPTVTHFLVKGSNSTVQLAWPAPPTGMTWLRVITACGIVVSGLVLALLLRAAAARHVLSFHAPLALATFGFAWWLLAPLGWLGWLLVAAAIWCAFRPQHFHFRATYETGSTILRSRQLR